MDYLSTPTIVPFLLFSIIGILMGSASHRAHENGVGLLVVALLCGAPYFAPLDGYTQLIWGTLYLTSLILSMWVSTRISLWVTTRSTISNARRRSS